MLSTLVEKIATYVSHSSGEDEVATDTDGEPPNCPIDGGKNKRRLQSLDIEEYPSAPKRRKVEKNFLAKLTDFGSKMAEWFVHGKNHLLSHWEMNNEDKQRNSQACCDKHCHHSGVQCLPQPSSEVSNNPNLRASSEHNPDISSDEAGRTVSKKNSKLKESQSVPNQSTLFKNKQSREMFIFKTGTQPKAFQKPIQLRKNFQHPARLNGGQRFSTPLVLTRSKLYSIPSKPWQHTDICRPMSNQQRSTAEEYIRLEEKERYAQLLRQCTSANYPDTSTTSLFQCQKSRSSSTSERSSNVPTVRDVASVIQLHRPTIVTCDSDQERSLSDLPSLQKRFSFSDTDTSQHSEHNFENSSACQDTNSSSGEKTSSKESSEHLSTSSAPNMKAIKILNEHWMEELVSKFSASNLERKKKIEEEHLKVKSLEEQRKSREHRVQLEIQRRLKLIQKEVPVIPEPETELAPEPEPQSECELKPEKALVPRIDELMQRDIDAALRPYPADDVLVDAFRIQLKRQDMATLSRLNWLNDAVINFYMCMLMERSNEPGFSKVYAFNTFFYPKLLSSKYEGVRRWTRKVDIFAHKYLIIPIHLEMHWCLAVVNFSQKTICYYDSIGGKNTQCLETIKNYLCEESLDKKIVPFDLNGWTTITVKNIPYQMNGSDCGMFACKYADYITRELPITFTQADMPTFRRLMVYEILKKKLLT
ncbi:sentrin-specific protease 1 [Octopus sinensis]|uniref:Sentrin-specific protease 1 n=1 Tax=Octopus sinensis TaxID=2607531 RepID=A0A6P7SVX6_9MOLL|nr:sentrin-specific protease 1 [Octopus sinensis]